MIVKVINCLLNLTKLVINQVLILWKLQTLLTLVHLSASVKIIVLVLTCIINPNYKTHT